MTASLELVEEPAETSHHDICGDAGPRGAEDRQTSADDARLNWLESDAIHILREVAGQCANPSS
jgi:hypothetical protein